jgi:hypothetical protein
VRDASFGIASFGIRGLFSKNKNKKKKWRSAGAGGSLLLAFY